MWLSKEKSLPVVGVLGAGTMGSGIAQVSLLAGHRVVLADTHANAVEQAERTMRKALARDVEKGRRTQGWADEALERLTFCPLGQSELPTFEFSTFAECGIVVEAVVESLDVKRAAFRVLEENVDASCVLATNTSSLSVTSIAASCSRPERVVGLHFFNPAPLMPLVELVPGLQTDDAVLTATRALVDGWGKTTVVARDTPGFIVNRVARPFYGEALRLLEEQVASAATIDWAMRDLGGFRMGPFELMDLIGHDVNYAVTSSVFEATYWDPRYRPAIAQRRLVEAGYLGRKTERGFYDYRDGARRPEPVRDEALGRAIVERVVAMLVNEAADALHLGLACAEDLELAMTKGVNYPKGLLAWGDEIGAARVLATLEGLQADYGDDRYRPSVLLRRRAREGWPLLG
jgi:3-hydroxybutyryl-CoA dehydrogenase